MQWDAEECSLSSQSLIFPFQNGTHGTRNIQVSHLHRLQRMLSVRIHYSWSVKFQDDSNHRGQRYQVCLDRMSERLGRPAESSSVAALLFGHVQTRMAEMILGMESIDVDR